jgi:hypothetical protein
MKDVVTYEKPRGAGNKRLIRGSPNEATFILLIEFIDKIGRT